MYQQYLNQARGILNYMSSDELREFLNDNDKLDERVDEILKSLDSEKDKIISENRALAESNLTKEPQLIELRAKVNEMSQEGKQLCEQIQEKLNEIKTKSSNSNPETILALLQTSSAECEEESDKISSEFLDNNLTVEEFMEKFMTSRKLMHLRKLKSEKMSELLQSQRTGQRPGPGGFYQHQQQQSSSSVPYPINPTMPMPGFKY